MRKKLENRMQHLYKDYLPKLIKIDYWSRRNMSYLSPAETAEKLGIGYRSLLRLVKTARLQEQ